MIAIRALNGTEIEVNQDAIILIAGPYPHDVGAHTYVHGVDRGVLVTAEDAGVLVARVGVPFAKLTRPNSTPVWVKGSAVQEIRAPLPTEQQPGGVVKAVLVVGDLHQAVREDVAAVAAVLNPKDAKMAKD
jgi:hypothetical protein